MILGSLLISVVVGSVCGICAFAADFGLLQSLAVYAVAGQVIFLIGSLISFFIGKPENTQHFNVVSHRDEEMPDGELVTAQ
jgi:hypothetical protein